MNTVVLKTQNLTKRYNGLTAVDDLSLEIHQGEIFGLLGPNGAGKTTSINLMCGLLSPDSGKVFIHDKEVNSGGTDVRTRVGVCPQEVILWEKLTCLEQIEFVGEMYNLLPQTARLRGLELLQTLGLSDKQDKLASTLSGGMQRRLNLALALVHDPDILVLDEPEAGLDPQSRVLVREYVRSLARQKTIILTTHNMDEADRLADRVAIIDHGKLLVLDTPEALKRSIGEGDVLELEIKGISVEQAIAAIPTTFPELTFLQASIDAKQSPVIEEIATSPAMIRNAMLTIRGQHIVEKLPMVIAIIQSLDGQVGEVRLRANTLEDVFIALTGRSLRE